MSLNNKTPELRFANYSEQWNKKHISELIDFYDEKTTVEDEYPILSSTMSGIYLQKDYFNNEVATKSNIGYKIVPQGYITYRAMSDTDLFHFNIQKLVERGIVSPAYPVFSAKEGICADFLITYMNENQWFKNQIAKNKKGGTRYALSGKKLSELMVNIPDECEQEEIAGYFLFLDEIITNLQNHLNKTRELKKACLQKFFPQQGKLIPEVRFSGFSGNWSRKKLGDIGTVQTCKRIFKEQTSANGDIPFFKNGTIGQKADAFIPREIYEQYKRLYPYPEVGDTLISVVGSIGRTAEYTGKDEYFQDSNVVWLKTNGNINKKYLKIYYQIIKWHIEGSTVKHLYNDNILKSEICVPNCEEEQKQIAEYFEEMDNLIQMYEQEIELILKIKKGCLQKMFI